jgi:hypothetical protein
MANMSNYLENKLIDHLFRGTSYTAPAALAVALCTAAPDDTSTGATITEVANSGAYARTALAPSSSNWQDTAGGTAGTSSGTTGTTKNAAAITFPTATGSWGTITHIAVVDSATYGAGNVLFWAALTTSKTVTNADTFSFAIAALTVQIDN